MPQKMENNNETKDKINHQLMSVQILPIMQVERLFCLLQSSILQVQPFPCFLVLQKPSLVHFCFVTWVLLTGFVSFFEQKVQGLLRTHLTIFQGLHSAVQKRVLSLCLFSVLPQHEQFYPEGLSMFAPVRHLRICVG